ncbi:hypothetical protein NDU88_005866 [Pleurodeles waltl]|uniref:Uncharacterized protein n=1 Tax=Pleurodeles waltl TaxID=8319 RepID=A0AAV7UJC7_PLEWA|nr:hypothetical protein NDU88_005866 [Pleurodeles waltl]
MVAPTCIYRARGFQTPAPAVSLQAITRRGPGPGESPRGALHGLRVPCGVLLAHGPVLRATPAYCCFVSGWLAPRAPNLARRGGLGVVAPTQTDACGGEHLTASLRRVLQGLTGSGCPAGGTGTQTKHQRPGQRLQPHRPQDGGGRASRTPDQRKGTDQRPPTSSVPGSSCIPD